MRLKSTRTRPSPRRPNKPRTATTPVLDNMNVNSQFPPLDHPIQTRWGFLPSSACSRSNVLRPCACAQTRIEGGTRSTCAVKSPPFSMVLLPSAPTAAVRSSAAWPEEPIPTMYEDIDDLDVDPPKSSAPSAPNQSTSRCFTDTMLGTHIALSELSCRAHQRR